MQEELTFESYAPWFNSQPPEVQDALRERKLDPEAVSKEVERLAAQGRNPKDYKTKVLYRAFYHSSDPSTQKTLIENGLIDPKDDHGIVKTNRSDADLAESNSLRTESLEMADSTASQIAESFDLSDTAAEQIQEFIDEKVATEFEKQLGLKIQRIAAVFLSAPNVRIAAGGLAFAAQLDALNGIGTQSEYARSIGVSKGAISKSTRHWKTLLNLPTNSNMKTDPACAAYSVAQSKKHWRKARYGSDHPKS